MHSRLSRSRQDYLKALLALGGARAVVTTSVLARHLRVSPPSATNMLRRLAAARLVVLAPGEGARLSAEGQRQAALMLRRHRILETFLVNVLGLDWSEVHDDAEVLEHHISDRVLDALDTLVGHPAEDPHGHPIPDARGRVPERALVPIAGLPSGSRATVREVRRRDRERMARWKQHGLVPGARVQVCDVDAVAGVVTLDVEGSRVVTGPAVLDGLLVEPAVGRRRA